MDWVWAYGPVVQSFSFRGSCCAVGSWTFLVSPLLADSCVHARDKRLMSNCTFECDSSFSSFFFLLLLLLLLLFLLINIFKVAAFRAEDLGLIPIFTMCLFPGRAIQVI